MPWCPACDRFLSPSTVTPEGACPRCGAPVDPGRARTASAPTIHAPEQDQSGVTAPAGGAIDRATAAAGAEDDETPMPLPWHFKLLVGAIALYLGWRAFQGVDWLVAQL